MVRVRVTVMVRVRVKVRVRVIFVLYYSVLYFLCCIFPYCIYSLDSEINSIMQNIDVTQETIAQLRSDKMNLRQNYSKHLKRNKFVLTQNILEIDETESKGEKSVDHWERKLKAYSIFIDAIIFSRT